MIPSFARGRPPQVRLDPPLAAETAKGFGLRGQAAQDAAAGFVGGAVVFGAIRGNDVINLASQVTCMPERNKYTLLWSPHSRINDNVYRIVLIVLMGVGCGLTLQWSFLARLPLHYSSFVFSFDVCCSCDFGLGLRHRCEAWAGRKKAAAEVQASFQPLVASRCSRCIGRENVFLEGSLDWPVSALGGLFFFISFSASCL